MNEAEQYQAHIAHLQALYERSLAGGPYEAVLLYSGAQQHYFGDDRGVPFQAFGHFCHWLPINRPDQALLIRPGQRPTYFQVIPRDFWYEQRIDTPAWCLDQFEVVTLENVLDIAGQVDTAALAWLGEPGRLSERLGLESAAINPSRLLHFVDFERAWKTDYEVRQLAEANRVALRGHEAARDCFLSGGSEFDIHLAYLRACEHLEDETPYTNIVALDDHAAILHYQNKRREAGDKGQVLLIDAGARVNNYGSDITRTTAREEAGPLFRGLLDGMESLQRDLVDLVRPGEPYASLHDAALSGIAELLAELGVCRGDAQTLVAESVPGLFMPHGVGHLLGVQVHDVGGHQADRSGGATPPPDSAPMLRNTRPMEAGMVFTVEPGCYFIPLILEEVRDSKRGQLIDWQAVEALYPLGGVRIEDNILVTAAGRHNLTRETKSSATLPSGSLREGGRGVQ